MLIAQHPIMPMSGKETFQLVLIVFGIYLAFQVTAYVLLQGKWKWLALPGLLCPLSLALFFFEPFIAVRIFFVSWIYTVGLAIVAILLKGFAIAMRTFRPASSKATEKTKSLE